MKNQLKLFVIILLITSILSCKEDNPVIPPDPPLQAISDTLTISLIAETHRSISINIKSTDNKTGKFIELRRTGGNDNYTLVSSYPAVVLDTTIIDDNDGNGLELDTEYGYYAVRLDSLTMPTDTSNVVTAKTLAATSHEYEWQEIVIGEFQSVLYDVWGTDENNVYAVGSVILNGEFYGVLHFDGTEWKGIKDAGGTAIFGFSANDIWVAGGGVFHYDGTEWKQIDSKTVNHHSEPLDSILFYNGSYTSIWGTSSSNLYFTSSNGKILHWDGNKASIVYSQSTIALRDIYGLNNNFIIAAGSGLTDPGIAIQNKNGVWEKVEGINYETTRLRSTYIVNKHKYYIVGERNYELINGQLTEILKSTPAMQYKIRGNDLGELVSVGESFSLNHFNGEDWKDYTYELTRPNSFFFGVYLTNTKVFTVGFLGVQAAIYIGTKK